VILPETEIWTFPGPDHYEGDVLSFEVPLGDVESFAVESATLTVDDVEIDAYPIVGRDPLLGSSRLVFLDAFDTDDQVGDHLVHVKAKLPGLEIDVRQRVNVAPAEDRPTQEVGTGWATVASDCCDVTYLEESAAARDLTDVVAVIDSSAAEVETLFDLSLPRVQFVLIDVVWANGGFATSEVVVSYLDRNYTTGRRQSFRQIVLHELTHAITQQIQISTPTPLVEGVAVHFTGGHTKPEPLGARARALIDRGELPGVAELFDTFADMQHESRYAAVGAFTQYMVETYGRDAVLDLYSFPQGREGSGWLNAAAQAILDTDVEALDAGFIEWVTVHDAGSQSDDLALSVALQEARRTYQARYSSYPTFSLYPSVADIAQSAVVMREALAPSLVAVEALIAYAQDLIIAGDLATAAPVVEEIERIAADGSIGVGISGEFLDRAEAVADAGFELIEYVPGSRVATVVATGQAPLLIEVDLELVDGSWRVTASRPVASSVNALGN
jgi:hypothetical protein